MSVSNCGCFRPEKCSKFGHFWPSVLAVRVNRMSFNCFLSVSIVIYFSYLRGIVENSMARCPEV